MILWEKYHFYPFTERLSNLFTLIKLVKVIECPLLSEDQLVKVQFPLQMSCAWHFMQPLRSWRDGLNPGTVWLQALLILECVKGSTVPWHLVSRENSRVILKYSKGYPFSTVSQFSRITTTIHTGASNSRIWRYQATIFPLDCCNILLLIGLPASVSWIPWHL